MQAERATQRQIRAPVQAQARLAEAQAATEEQVRALVEPQRRTEQVVEALAEAQNRSSSQGGFAPTADVTVTFDAFGRPDAACTIRLQNRAGIGTVHVSPAGGIEVELP